MDRRFPDGSIRMQLPHFKKRGLDLNSYFSWNFVAGTLNLSFAPQTYDILKPEYFMEQVRWTEELPSENFYLSPASVVFRNTTYLAMIYIPDPATKITHFNPPTMVDVICEPIKDIGYGDEVTLSYNPEAIRLKA